MGGIVCVQPEATLHPGKPELLARRLPNQQWFGENPPDLEIVAKFRFAGPDDVVGLDCMLVRSTNTVYHIPVTWRSHSPDGGTLIGALQYSELGIRYCYDARTDPVYLDKLVRVTQEKDSDADIVEAGKNAPCPKSIKVFDSGLMAGETSGYPHMVHKLNHAPINDVVGRLIGQWHHHGIGRADLLTVLRWEPLGPGVKVCACARPGPTSTKNAPRPRPCSTVSPSATTC